MERFYAILRQRYNAHCVCGNQWPNVAHTASWLVEKEPGDDSAGAEQAGDAEQSEQPGGVEQAGGAEQAGDVEFYVDDPANGGCPFHDCQCATCSVHRGLGGIVVHKFKKCDECGVCPIFGPRFHCMVCRDFDLCIRCVAQNAHAEHAMVRVTEPEPIGCTCE